MTTDGKSAAPPPEASALPQSEASKAYHQKALREQRKAAKLAEQTSQAQARFAQNAKTFADHDLVRPHEETTQDGATIGVLAPVQIDKLPEYFDEVHGAAMAMGADCRRCPLRLSGNGPVLHEVRPGSKLTIVGEAPGPTEVQLGRPNAGWSGNILNISMSVGDVVREDTTMANVIMCSAPTEMTYAEMQESFALAHKRACRQADIIKQPHPPAPLTPDVACRGALKNAIVQTAAPVLLTLGKQALEATSRVIEVSYDKDKHDIDDVHIATLANQHGAPVWLPPRVTVATGAKVLLAAYHPAYAAREKKEWLPAIMDVITRAAKAASTDLAVLAWNEFCEKCWIEPSIDEIIEFCRVALERKLEVTVDVETDGPDRVKATLRLIQFAMMVDGVEWAINIPIRHMDGSSWWATQAEVDRFKPWVVRVLDELPLAGQFLQYDTAVLLRSDGWMTNSSKSWTDLTILYRATRDNDLPKNLAAIVSRLHPAPRWKKDVDFKSVDNVDDRHLLRYGIKDVIYEMRCLEPLRKRVTECDSWPSVEIDSALLPVWRDMGLLGLVVNEHERGQYSRTFNRAVSWLTVDFQNKVGRPINPNSVPQLQDLIFGEWGYRPVILPDGTELDDSTTAIWDDEELGSTSSAALIQLQKRRAVSGEHAAAFDTLLELRAYQKLRGTYTDNLNTYDEDTDEWNRLAPRVPAVREMRLSADKNNEFKHWDEVECLPERGLFSRLLPVYLSHTIPTGRAASQGPNCFDVETEVLTRRGWIFIKDLTDEDFVAQYLPDSRSVEFVKPTRRTSRAYSGEMVSVQNTSIDLRVTADHRLAFWTRKSDAEKIRTAGELWPEDHKVRHAGVYTQGRRRLLPWQVTLLCAAQADAHLERGRTEDPVWDFMFKRPRKIKRLRAALKASGATYTEAKTTRQRVRFRVSGEVAEWILGIVGPAREFGSWLLDFDAHTLTAIREELYQWDGCETRQCMYSSSDRRSADWAQVVHVLTGERANVRTYHPERLVRPNYQVDRLKNRDYSMSTNAEVRRELVRGERVYCLSVPSEHVLVRRRGKCTITLQCQNVPAAGKANMRTMLVAPPDHVIVGADFDQLEARIYAALTGDKKILQAIKENLDIHSMNAATLLAKHESEFWPWYHKVAESNAALKKGDKEKGAFAKYWRTVAKRFAFLCIEEGTPVLTHRGEVPIESVRAEDLLWDGVEWVKHDGVVCRGEKETIEYDGLCATEDHEVWVQDGRKMQLGEAAKRCLPLARGAIGGRPIRFVGDVQPGLEEPRPLQSDRNVHWLRPTKGIVPSKHSSWKDVRYASTELVARRRGKARVYDILNAGPRRRFTASGIVTSNCIYGGEIDILWDVMSNARDRADGKLSFPKLTLEDVIIWHERWHRDHPETREWHESSHDAMSETGYSVVPGLDGRKRWFPGGPSKVNAVPNMLVQGLAASIANRAMLAISEEIPFRSWSRWTGLSLQIHDYLQVYVPVSRYEEAMRIVNRCMPWEFNGVPITAEANVSWNLAQQG